MFVGRPAEMEHPPAWVVYARIQPVITVIITINITINITITINSLILVPQWGDLSALQGFGN